MRVYVYVIAVTEAMSMLLARALPINAKVYMHTYIHKARSVLCVYVCLCVCMYVCG